MATKSMMVDFQILRTNHALQAKLTNRHIKRDGNGMALTIGRHQAVYEMQKNWWDEQRIHQCLDLPHIICTLSANFFCQ